MSDVNTTRPAPVVGGAPPSPHPATLAPHDDGPMETPQAERVPEPHNIVPNATPLGHTTDEDKGLATLAASAPTPSAPPPPSRVITADMLAKMSERNAAVAAVDEAQAKVVEFDLTSKMSAEEKKAHMEASKKKAEANKKSEDGMIDGQDARMSMAVDLAQRGLAFASVNDLAKAVVLIIDIMKIAKPGDSDIAKAAAAGEAPALL